MFYKDRIIALKERLAAVESEIDGLYKTKRSKEKEDSPIPYIYKWITDNIDDFSAKAGELLTEEELMRLIVSLLIPVARNGFANEERKLKLFYEGEKMGVHILPTHFYSPVPTTLELADQPWKEPLSPRPVNFDEDLCKGLLENFMQYKMELKHIPAKAENGTFGWENPAILAVDSSIYYYMIRHFKPKHVIEVGSGYSTLLASKAAEANQTTVFEAIEPYPMDFLKKEISGLSKLTPLKIQDVTMDWFDALEENDILFVDNSHVSKAGSDVNHIMLKILPRLKKGVIVHFHDIQLPDEMPKSWVMEKEIFWNEEYLLQALLLGGNRYRTIMPVHWLGENAEEELKKLVWPEMPKYSGGSYWIRVAEN